MAGGCSLNRATACCRIKLVARWVTEASKLLLEIETEKTAFSHLEFHEFGLKMTHNFELPILDQTFSPLGLWRTARSVPEAIQTCSYVRRAQNPQGRAEPRLPKLCSKSSFEPHKNESTVHCTFWEPKFSVTRVNDSQPQEKMGGPTPALPKHMPNYPSKLQAHHLRKKQGNCHEPWFIGLGRRLARLKRGITGKRLEHDINQNPSWCTCIQ